MTRFQDKITDKDGFPTADLFNHVDTRELARLFCDRLPADFQTLVPNGPYAIDHTLTTALACLFQDFIAGVIATLIDAGSEADAVNEDPDLFHSLCEAIQGWTDHPDNHPDLTPENDKDN